MLEGFGDEGEFIGERGLVQARGYETDATGLGDSCCKARGGDTVHTGVDDDGGFRPWVEGFEGFCLGGHVSGLVVHEWS